MKSPSFEIKIAFCGYVNAGKSTLVNALLQQKYTEVSMNRTTLGVNSFRVFLNKGEKDVEEFETLSSKSTEESETGAVTTWSVGPEKLQSAAETHRIIVQANADAREINEIKETTFDIEVREAICDMRDDTQLVVVDLPGFTDVTDEEDIHVKYLNAKWDAYDCVVVVLDVMEKPSKQVDLVKLVKKNLKEKKDIPVVFVCNKVDNPDNSEVGEKLKDLEFLVGEMFLPNVCVSLSANDAMVYRAMSAVSFEQFQQFDMTWINKIGIDDIGRSKWRQMLNEQKLDAAYKLISDASAVQEILTASNFPKFLGVLAELVGGSTAQLELIQKQLEVALKEVQCFDETTMTTISKIKCISERLGIATAMSFKDHFWTTYKKYVANSTETYKLNTDHKVFNLAMTHLIAYDAELSQASSDEVERRKVLDEMISLVRLQFMELLTYAESWQQRYLSNKETIDISVYKSNAYWKLVLDDSAPSTQSTYNPKTGGYTPPKNYNYNDAHHWERLGMDLWKNIYTNEEKKSKYNPGGTNKEDWQDLSMQDFVIAFSSILLLSYSKPFWLYFGREKMRMDSLLRKFDCLHAGFIENPKDCMYRCMFQSISGSYSDSGEFVPDNMDKFKIFVHFNKTPDHFSNPEHWGHLAWKFCEFMERRSRNSA